MSNPPFGPKHSLPEDNTPAEPTPGAHSESPNEVTQSIPLVGDTAERPTPTGTGAPTSTPATSSNPNDPIDVDATDIRSALDHLPENDNLQEDSAFFAPSPGESLERFRPITDEDIRRAERDAHAHALNEAPNASPEVLAAYNRFTETNTPTPGTPVSRFAAPQPQPQPQPTPEPLTEPAPEPAPASEPAPETKAEAKARKKANKRTWGASPLLAVIIIVGALVGAGFAGASFMAGNNYPNVTTSTSRLTPIASAPSEDTAATTTAPATNTPTPGGKTIKGSLNSTITLDGTKVQICGEGSGEYTRSAAVTGIACSVAEETRDTYNDTDSSNRRGITITSPVSGNKFKLQCSEVDTDLVKCIDPNTSIKVYLGK